MNYILCNLIGSSTSSYITSYPISSEKKPKIAERLAKVNEQEIRELLDNTTPKIPCLSI